MNPLDRGVHDELGKRRVEDSVDVVLLGLLREVVARSASFTFSMAASTAALIFFRAIRRYCFGDRATATYVRRRRAAPTSAL